MNHELAKTLTTALVQFIDRERPEGTMCCSNTDCANLENAFNSENFTYVEAYIKMKLLRLTEFEEGLVTFYNKRNEILSNKDGVYNKHELEEFLHESAKTLLALAKKELLSYADESNPAIEAMADLERTFECNPEKLPLWLRNELDRIKLEAHTKGYNKGYKKAEEEYNKSVSYHYDDELGKKHLEGYIMGREDTMREMKDFIESHFNTNKAREGEDLTDLYRKEYAQPLCLRNGGVCTNPMRDCINCIPTLERFNTSSGTSTATLHGNTSVTDGKEHNPSFTD